MTKLPAGTRSLVIEREMPHPPEKVWRALTQGPLIEEWLMKNDFQPVVGRRFNFRAPPMPHWNGVTDCEVLVVEPNERLSYSWNASGDEAAGGLKTVVTWTLTSTKGGVLVRMEQSGFRPEDRGWLPGRELRLAAVPRRPGTGDRRAGLTMQPGVASELSKPMIPTREEYSLHPVGHIRSMLRALDEAPRQGSEGAPDAWLEVDPTFARGLFGIAAGDEIIVVTWLHRADRDVLEVHPRGDPEIPLAGVFATRSPHRPNPLGLHRVTVREISGTRLRIGPIEAIDGTPVVDGTPVLIDCADA